MASVKLGSTLVDNFKLGSSQVADIYLGATQVWHNFVNTVGSWFSASATTTSTSTTATSSAFTVARVTEITATCTGNTSGDGSVFKIEVLEGASWVQVATVSTAVTATLTATFDKNITQWRCNWAGGATVSRALSGAVTKMYV